MKKVLSLVAHLLAKVTFTAAVAGAESASWGGIYQPKTPQSLVDRSTNLSVVVE
ncbi:MAG: cyclic lactone autoinducer peptide [Defluviitaleaceae bacterium]|nr:cyclic lactone autoinducer peptide [Defluviitaleaceae bacterium]